MMRTMTHMMPDPTQPKPCDQCRHFGYWIAVDVAGTVRGDVHCWCQRPASHQVIARPMFGCAFWAPAAYPAQPAPAHQPARGQT